MTIRTKPASKEYRDGWDRVFGKPKPDADPYPVSDLRTFKVGGRFAGFPAPTVEVHGAKPSAIRERKP